MSLEQIAGFVSCPLLVNLSLSLCLSVLVCQMGLFRIVVSVK
jgi:hypothetical protein